MAFEYKFSLNKNPNDQLLNHLIRKLKSHRGFANAILKDDSIYRANEKDSGWQDFGISLHGNVLDLTTILSGQERNDLLEIISDTLRENNCEFETFEE